MSDIKDISQYFDRAAKAFDFLYQEDKMSPFYRFINRKFRRDIYERFKLSINHIIQYKAKSALDVGCGSGRYTLTLAQCGVKRIVNIDASSEMINLAKKRAEYIQSPNINLKFICADFAEFQTEEMFDVVLAIGFFDYVNNPVLVLKKMKALTNHSVIASFPSRSFYRTPIRKLRYYFKNCPVYFYKPEQILLFSEQAGFSKSEITKIKGAGMDYFVTFFI